MLETFPGEVQAGRSGVIRRSHRRALAGILVAVTVIAVTASAAAALTRTHKAATRPARGSVQPAAVTTVKVLASKLLEQHGTGAGAVGALTNVGPISARAVCTDIGSGAFRNDFQLKSSVAGTCILGTNGSAAISGSFVTQYTLSSSAGYGFGFSFDAMTAGWRLPALRRDVQRAPAWT